MTSQIQTAPTRNPLFSENPLQVERSLKRQALCYNILSKITMVALAAIALGVLVVSFGVGASVPWLSHVLFGGVLLTPILSYPLSKLQKKKLELEAQSQMATRIANKYRELQALDADGLRLSMYNSGIPIGGDRITLPERELLPVIAHYQAYEEIRQEAHQELQANFGLESSSHAVMLEAKRKGYSRLERDELPAGLMATLMLKIMQEPALQARNLSDIGECRIKDCDERILDRAIHQDDTYFIGKDGRRVPFDRLQKGLASLPPKDMLPIIFG